MKRLFCLVLCFLAVLPTLSLGRSLGVVTTASHIQLEVLAADSSGNATKPDSGHVDVWFQDRSTANSTSYSGRWATGGAAGTEIDSSLNGGTVTYYYTNTIGSIDGDEGIGAYSGVVTLFAKSGLQTKTPFDFTIAADTWPNYMAAITSLPATILHTNLQTWQDSARYLFGTLLAVGCDSGLYANINKPMVMSDTTPGGELWRGVFGAAARDSVWLASVALYSALIGTMGHMNGGSTWFNAATDAVIPAVTNANGDTIATASLVAGVHSDLMELFWRLSVAVGGTTAYHRHATVDTNYVYNQDSSEVMLQIRKHPLGVSGGTPDGTEVGGD